MPRFFVPAGQIKNDRIHITGNDVNHIARVLRMAPGDKLTVLDGRGNSYEARIEAIAKAEVVCSVVRQMQATGAPPVRITLVQGIPKGDKMDLIIQKSVELGVNRIIPLVCKRSVVKLDQDRSLRRQERWQRIALEAAKQCRRPDVPQVTGPRQLDQVLSGMSSEDLALLPWEEESDRSVKEVLQAGMSPGETYVFIGPEGGFTPDEAEQARAGGALTVTLGPRILRTETAGLAVLTMILYQWGDLGGN